MSGNFVLGYLNRRSPYFTEVLFKINFLYSTYKWYKLLWRQKEGDNRINKIFLNDLI